MKKNLALFTQVSVLVFVFFSIFSLLTFFSFFRYLLFFSFFPFFVSLITLSRSRQLLSKNTGDTDEREFYMDLIGTGTEFPSIPPDLPGVHGAALCPKFFLVFFAPNTNHPE